jgi:MoxR-like ATPase
VDYRNLKEYNPKNAPATGMMYADPQNPKQTIIRVFSGTAKLGEQGAERVTLYRDDRNLYINGVRFPMRRLQRGEQQQLWLGNVTLTDRDYEQELETVNAAVEKLFRELQGNMFISEEDKTEVGKYVALVRKEIAWARVDVRKLRYGDES